MGHPHIVDSEANSGIQRDRVLLGILLFAGLLGVIYNFVILLGFGPDEPRHMNYVKLLLDEQRLPYVEANGSEHAGAHTLHPPLYYLTLLPFYAIFRGLPGEWEWHLVRLVSLAICLFGLVLIYQIGLRASRGDQNLARLVTAQVGLLPIFGMTAGTINNDSATFLAVSAFLWMLAVKYPNERTLKSAIALGVCFGVGGLCKATVLLCNGAALLCYFLAQDGGWAWRSFQNWKRMGLVLLLVGLISGPWYARNISLYGQFTPIAPGYTHPGLPNPALGKLVMMLHDNFPTLFGAANWGIFSTLWSQKDWIPEAVRGAVYLVLSFYCLSAIAGSFIQFRRHKSAKLSEDSELRNADLPDTIAGQERVACWPAYGAFAINWLACLTIALFVHWGWAEGGRYLLPALVGLSLFLARGWRGLVGPARLGVVTALWSLALLFLNVLTIYWLLHFLNPTFGPKG